MPIAEGPYARITTNTSTQVRTGPSILKKIVILGKGTAWVATIRDGDDDADPIRMVLQISDGASVEVPINSPDFRTGLRVVTTGTTPGEILVYFDHSY